jgi:biotin carboxyl carrier protein
LNECTGKNESGRPVSRGSGDISTSMSGNVVEVMVSEDAQVTIGDTLFIIEAM